MRARAGLAATCRDAAETRRRPRGETAEARTQRVAGRARPVNRLTRGRFCDSQAGYAKPRRQGMQSLAGRVCKAGVCIPRVSLGKGRSRRLEAGYAKPQAGYARVCKGMQSRSLGNRGSAGDFRRPPAVARAGRRDQAYLQLGPARRQSPSPRTLPAPPRPQSVRRSQHRPPPLRGLARRRPPIPGRRGTGLACLLSKE